MLDTFGIMDYRSFGGGDTASPDISYIMYTSRTCILYDIYMCYYFIIIIFYTRQCETHAGPHGL